MDDDRLTGGLSSKLVDSVKQKARANALAWLINFDAADAGSLTGVHSPEVRERAVRMMFDQ